MSRSSRAVGIALLGGLPVAGLAQTLEEVGKAFVWRINPPDYFFAEARFGNWFSRTNDLVLLRTDGDGKPVQAVAVTRASDTSYRVSLHTFADPRDRIAGAELRTRSATIEASIGRQLEAAVSFRLRGLVLLDQHPKNPEDSPQQGAWWIFQRDKANKIDTAMIQAGAAHMNDQARGFLSGIVGNLVRYVDGNEDDRPVAAELLNDAAMKIAKGELPERY